MPYPVSVRNCRPVLLVSIVGNVILIGLFVLLDQRIHLLTRMAGALDIDIPWLGARAQKDLAYKPVDGNAIKVYGIYGFDYQHPIYDRLAFFAPYVRQELREIAARTSGARLRFKTNSRRLHIIATGVHPSGFSYPSLSEAGSAGLDLFIEGKYVKTITLRTINDVIDIGSMVPSHGLAAVEIYLPIFSRCQIKRIGFDKESRIEPPDEFQNRITFYGTSITQGASASRPSLTYPAVLARMLNMDFYNFGFSGNARGDAALADVLSDTRADLYVMEYSRQAENIDGIDKNLIRFITRIRDRHPSARILIISSIFDTSEHLGDQDLAGRRLAFLAGFQELRKSVAEIYFIDGMTLMGPEDEDGLADGTHLNALGAYRIADRLIPVIRGILKNAPHE